MPDGFWVYVNIYKKSIKHEKSSRLSFWDEKATFSIDSDGRSIYTDRKSMRWAFHFIFVELRRTKLATFVIFLVQESKSSISRKRLFQRAFVLSRRYRSNSGFSGNASMDWTVCGWNSKGSSQLLDLPFQFLIQRSSVLFTDPPCRIFLDDLR